MNNRGFYCLPSISVLDVTGADALKIVHNLTTNEVLSLDDQCGCESFVTDVKGKTVGHVSIFRDGPSLRLIGPAAQSQQLASHFDRYTIVEDSKVTILDDQVSAIVLPRDSVAHLTPDSGHSDDCRRTVKISDLNDWGYEVDWLGPGTLALISANENADLLRDYLLKSELSESDEQAFHQARTRVGFPWYGIDFDEKNLPQEVERNENAISFTKGCYLGQETVARLDAMGQLQKKLVRWALSGVIPAPNVEVVSGGKTVGRLTSIAPTSDNTGVAIGIARRSHFDPGAEATGTSGQSEFTARVV